MSFIVVDVYEPDYMNQLLSAFMQVQKQNLVQQELCDYFWFAGDGHSITMERKEINDLLANFDRLEAQLRKATNHANEVGLIVEGIPVPLEGGELAIYEQGKNEKYLHRTKINGTKFVRMSGYLLDLKRTANITTYFTTTIKGTAWMLKTMVENSQKPSTDIMQHYVRTRQIKWQSNPVIETIMAIKDKDGYVVGEKKAQLLYENIGSLWDIIHMPPEEINYACGGIGLATAKRLINAVKGVK